MIFFWRTRVSFNPYNLTRVIFLHLLFAENTF
jgi:hypothetical protein